MERPIDINEEQFIQMLHDVMPDLFLLHEALNQTKTNPNVVMDFIYETHKVKINGWGSVVCTVQRNQITSLEGKTQKLYAVPQYEKKK